MPSINLRKPVYDELIRQDEDPVEYVNRVMADHIKAEYDVEVEA